MFFMKYVTLQDILQPEQKYVLDYANIFRKDIQAVKHDFATDTCFEKADLMGWNPEQVVKAVFLYGNNGKFYGFVSPELGTRSNQLVFNQKTLSEIFSNKKGYNKNFRKDMLNLDNKRVPLGMERGTCTPFVLDYYFEQGDGLTGFLEKIYIYDPNNLENKKVDISIGGLGKEAHMVSVHLNYSDIYECLNWKFPGSIEKFNL